MKKIGSVEGFVSSEGKFRFRASISPIPTRLMSDYIREMQRRLREKKIGYKREFLREILKEVSVRGHTVTLTYRLPIGVRPIVWREKLRI